MRLAFSNFQFSIFNLQFSIFNLKWLIFKPVIRGFLGDDHIMDMAFL